MPPDSHKRQKVDYEPSRWRFLVRVTRQKIGKQKIVKKTVPIINKLGLHARAAAVLVQTANKFEAEITLEKKGNSTVINGKSIMGVLMLAAPYGSSLTIKAEGEDADIMVAELSQLVAQKFWEEEFEKKK